MDSDRWTHPLMRGRKKIKYLGLTGAEFDTLFKAVFSF